MNNIPNLPEDGSLLDETAPSPFPPKINPGTTEEWISWATANNYHPLAIEAFRDYGFNGRQAEILNNVIQAIPNL